MEYFDFITSLLQTGLIISNCTMVASNNLQLQEACSVFLSNKELSIRYVYLLNRLIQNIEIIHESRHLISTGIKTHLPFRNQQRVKCHKSN